MTRENAYKLLTKHLHNKNLQKHCLACEASMKALYMRITSEDAQRDDEKTKWGITGLLHDVDYEIAQNENRLDRHGILLFDDPRFEDDANSIPEDIAHGIKAHAYEYTGVEPESPMDWGITCIDQLTGLIIACALIHPDKKLAPLTVDFVKNRMKEKSFAKGAKREPILLCEEKLDITLDEFILLVLTAMQGISDELGL